MFGKTNVSKVRKTYPKGTKIRLIHVDDCGQIHVAWETGSSLALIPDVDQLQIASQISANIS